MTAHGSQEPEHGQGTILVVDDDPVLRRTVVRALMACGFDVDAAEDGQGAVECLATSRYDCVVSDIQMPRMDGMELLRNIRNHDPDVPFVIITGTPSIDTAIEAVRYGAINYLQKPLRLEELEATVRRSVTLREMARLKRKALSMNGAIPTAGDRAALEAAFEGALDEMWIAYQPIVAVAEQSVYAYEALLRSDDKRLPHPGAILSAAERLDRLPQLSRRIRALAPQGVQALSEALFINLHPSDLLDDALFDPREPLSAIAKRVVLEITERAPLDGVVDIRQRIRRLKDIGFSVAIDDLGAGYAGLSSFAALEPDIVKLDMSLIRDIDRNATKRKIVSSMTTLCRDLGTRVVAEGVETRAEQDVLVEIGVDMLQGYLLAKPTRTIAPIQWAA